MIKTIDRLHDAFGRPMIIPETAYPSTDDFKGQFATWRKESPGYPLSAEGQRRWLSDFLDFCAHKDYIASVYYWSPEWSGDTMWKGFALFDSNHQSRSAWSAFKGQRAERTVPKQPVYFEIQNGNLYRVPLRKAREKATEMLKASYKLFGKVNNEYIQDISSKTLIVDGYSVSLRSSLSGNIDLTNTEDKAGVIDSNELLSKSGNGHRLVVFVDDPEDKAAMDLAQAARSRNTEVYLHPHKPDKALKFGLDTHWQKPEEQE